jgi:serine/threonine-protein kinase
MNNRLDPRDILTLSSLLDEGMELRPELIEPWLAALGAEHRHLVPRLREMLTEHLSATQSPFMQGGPQVCGVEPSGLRPGQTIGGYTLVCEIGRGGMGCVWLAERLDSGKMRRVALKLPRSDRGPVPADRMGQEGDIGALMMHPNVVRLLQSGMDPLHGRYLAMEYLEGQPLDTWCDSQSVGIPGRLQLFLQVVRAVAHAHALGVVHLDIKPSNVLVTRDGQVHLLDFGIARRLTGSDEEQGAQQRLRILTPGYASPEQRCKEQITFASDVYSLGALCCRLLTGRLPPDPEGQDGCDLHDLLGNRETALAGRPMLDDCQQQRLFDPLAAILKQAFCREPSRRFATAHLMAESIERCLESLDPPVACS